MGSMRDQGGARLTGYARTVGSDGGLLAKLFVGGTDKLVAQIDKGLKTGKINAILPDGSRRTVGGHAPGFECTVHLHDWRALVRLAVAGSQGWYRAWERREWSSPDPVPLFALFMANGESLGATARAKGPWRRILRFYHGLRRNSPTVSQHNIHAHYDLGNDFYAEWLDATMSYSSARFDGIGDGPDRLELGQRRKWDRLEGRLDGASNILEIGCGWGALAAHLARNGATIDAISLSDEQLAWAREHHAASNVDFRKQDYRDTSGSYDGIVSVEMVEAVGREYWHEWFGCVARNLKDGGRAAIQYIAIRDELFDAYAASADFIQAYIFPGGMLASESEFRLLAAEHGLSWEDQEDFGADYAETLMLWRQRFERAVAEDRLPPGFDSRFIDLWRYYLMYCEGGFRGGGIVVSQVTLVKGTR